MSGMNIAERYVPQDGHITIMCEGRKVDISSCPNGHGKVKSPMCCGEDMTCPIG